MTFRWTSKKLLKLAWNMFTARLIPCGEKQLDMGKRLEFPFVLCFTMYEEESLQDLLFIKITDFGTF